MSFEFPGSTPLSPEELFTMRQKVKVAADFPDLLQRLDELAAFATAKGSPDAEFLKAQEDLVRQLTEALSGKSNMPVTEDLFLMIDEAYGIRETVDKLYGEWRLSQQS